MFNDVLEEEGNFFIMKISKAQSIAVSVIQEFVSRVLQRMVYGKWKQSAFADFSGMGPKDKFGCVRTYRQGLRGLLLFHYFPYLSRLLRSKQEDSDGHKTTNALCVENQLQKQTIEHPELLSYIPLWIFSHYRQYIVSNASSVISGSLHQAVVGLLSTSQIGRQAQSELDKLLSTNTIHLDDIDQLEVLPAIVAESLRLNLISSPIDPISQISQDLWYRKFFLPQNSIVIFDPDEIFSKESKLSDSQVCVLLIGF